jgi:hypothetical protein
MGYWGDWGARARQHEGRLVVVVVVEKEEETAEEEMVLVEVDYINISQHSWISVVSTCCLCKTIFQCDILLYPDRRTTQESQYNANDGQCQTYD